MGANDPAADFLVKTEGPQFFPVQRLSFCRQLLLSSVYWMVGHVYMPLRHSVEPSWNRTLLLIIKHTQRISYFYALMLVESLAQYFHASAALIVFSSLRPVSLWWRPLTSWASSAEPQTTPCALASAAGVRMSSSRALSLNGGYIFVEESLST